MRRSRGRTKNLVRIKFSLGNPNQKRGKDTLKQSRNTKKFRKSILLVLIYCNILSIYVYVYIPNFFFLLLDTPNIRSKSHNVLICFHGQYFFISS